MLQIANNPRKRAKRFWGLFWGDDIQVVPKKMR